MTDSSTKILFLGEALFRTGQKATHFYLVRRGAISSAQGFVHMRAPFAFSLHS